MTALRYVIILALIFLFNLIFGQQNTFNQFDAKGKKTGYWKVYLDEKAMPMDSAKSVFWGYKFYDEGKEPYKYFQKYKISKSDKYVFDGSIPPKGKPIPINGVLKEYDVRKEKDDRLYIEITFKNGYPQLIEEHIDSINLFILDFTKKYENKEGSFFQTEYNSYFVLAKGLKEIRYSWFRKENNTWKLVKADASSSQ